METSIDTLRVVSVALVNGVNESLNVNGSVTPVSFSAVPPAGKKWRVKRITGYIEGANHFSSEKFADLPALANGVVLKINGVVLKINGVVLKINGVEIARWKTNRNMVFDMGFIETPTALAKADRSLAGEFCFVKAFGEMLLVDSNTGGIEIVVNDNLSTVANFKVKVQGVVV
jgi:hypothetical protein